eukprot:gene7316-18477_t
MLIAVLLSALPAASAVVSPPGLPARPSPLGRPPLFPAISPFSPADAGNAAPIYIDATGPPAEGVHSWIASAAAAFPYTSRDDGAGAGAASASAVRGSAAVGRKRAGRSPLWRGGPRLVLPLPPSPAPTPAETPAAQWINALAATPSMVGVLVLSAPRRRRHCNEAQGGPVPPAAVWLFRRRRDEVGGGLVPLPAAAQLLCRRCYEAGGGLVPLPAAAQLLRRQCDEMGGGLVPLPAAAQLLRRKCDEMGGGLVPLLAAAQLLRRRCYEAGGGLVPLPVAAQLFRRKCDEMGGGPVPLLAEALAAPAPAPSSRLVYGNAAAAEAIQEWTPSAGGPVASIYMGAALPASAGEKGEMAGNSGGRPSGLGRAGTPIAVRR